MLKAINILGDTFSFLKIFFYLHSILGGLNFLKEIKTVSNERNITAIASFRTHDVVHLGTSRKWRMADS